MITKHDWDAAMGDWIAEERERLGGPPTPEEVVAYTRGELSESEADRVRALLVYYPHLTDLLDSRAEVPSVQSWIRRRRTLAVAASLVIALLGGLLGRAQWTLAEKERESREPYVHQARHELRSFRARGPQREPASISIPAGQPRFLLVPMLDAAQLDHDAYRIDIVELGTRDEKTVWSTTGVQPIGTTFEISIARDFLRPRVAYRIDVYGLDRGPQLLGSYPFHVSPGR